MNSEQKKLLKVLEKDVIESPENNFILSRYGDKKTTGDYFLADSAETSQGGEGMQITTHFPEQSLESLKDDGYIGLEVRKYAVWITPKGVSLVEQKFKNQ